MAISTGGGPMDKLKSTKQPNDKSNEIPVWIQNLFKFLFKILIVSGAILFVMHLFIGFDYDCFVRNVHKDMLESVETYNAYSDKEHKIIMDTDVASLSDEHAPVITTLRGFASNNRPIVVQISSSRYGERLEKKVFIDSKLTQEYRYPQESFMKRAWRRICWWTKFGG